MPGTGKRAAASLRGARRTGKGGARLRLTARDRELVAWVYLVQLATREQLQRLFFSQGGRSRCQYRLTLLFRHRFLDRLPHRAPNDPDIYYLSRRATRGLRLLRQLRPDEEVHPRRISGPRVQHTLEVANCRAVLLRACKAPGYSLSLWLGEDELSQRMQASRIIPDAYFQITRPTPDGPKTAGFFLEVERSGKSSASLEEKFRRLGEYYYQGHYEREFGTRALRVLMLLGDDYDINPDRQIAKCSEICRRLGVTLLRFAALEDFLTREPAQLLFAQFWHQPKEDALCALF